MGKPSMKKASPDMVFMVTTLITLCMLPPFLMSIYTAISSPPTWAGVTVAPKVFTKDIM